MSKTLLTVPVVPISNCSVTDTTFGRTDNTIQDYLDSCSTLRNVPPVATAPIAAVEMDVAWADAAVQPFGTFCARVAPRAAVIPWVAGDANINMKSIPSIWWVGAYYVRINLFSFQALPPMQCVVKYERDYDTTRARIRYHEEASRRIVIEALGPADPSSSIMEFLILPVQVGYILQAEQGTVESLNAAGGAIVTAPAQPMQAASRTFLMPDNLVANYALSNDDFVALPADGLQSWLTVNNGSSKAVNFFFPALTQYTKGQIPSIQVSPFFVSWDTLPALRAMFL